MLVSDNTLDHIDLTNKDPNITDMEPKIAQIGPKITPGCLKRPKERATGSVKDTKGQPRKTKNDKKMLQGKPSRSRKEPTEHQMTTERVPK